MKQLQRPNETPDAVLRRLERRPDYHRLIATSDEGQATLDETSPTLFVRTRPVGLSRDVDEPRRERKV
jgi:hypothetical protein